MWQSVWELLIHFTHGHKCQIHGGTREKVRIRNQQSHLGFIYWEPWMSIPNFMQIHMDFYWISGILTYCWPLMKRKEMPLGFILWRQWMHGNPKVEEIFQSQPKWRTTRTTTDRTTLLSLLLLVRFSNHQVSSFVYFMGWTSQFWMHLKLN